MRSRDAAGFVMVFLVLLIALPAQLVVSPIGASGTPANLLALGGLLWWAAVKLLPPRLDTTFNPTRVGVGLFSAALVASYGSANLHVMPSDQLSAADRGLISVAAWAGIALVTAEMVNRGANVERLLRVAVWLASGLAAVGIVEFLTGANIAQLYKIPGLVANSPLDFIGDRSDFRRVAGTALHPIEFGMVLATMFPIAVHFASHATRHRRAHKIALALICVGIPMSLSRSAFLGLAVGSVILLSTWSWRRRLRALGAASVFGVVMRFAIPGLLGTVKSLFTGFGSDPSIQGRTDDYSQVGTFVGQHPWLGRGFGTFLPKTFFFLDNQYLGIVIEAGFIGLTAMVLLFVVGVFTARGARRRSSDEEERDLYQALAASIATVMIGYITFDGFGFPMISGLLFFLLGCAGAAWRSTRTQRAAPETSSAAAPRALALAAGTH